MSTHNPRTRSTRPRFGKLRRVLAAISDAFRGSASGATAVEYIVVTGFCALFAIFAFNRFGSTVNRGLRAEAAHIRGEGLPNAADVLDALNGLTAPEGQCRLLPNGGRICVGGSQLCFGAGTLVATEHGERRIETLLPGDRVWSRNVETNEVALRPIVSTFTTRGVPVMDLELRSELLGEERLQVTAGHRFWVQDEGWVRADALTAKPLWSTDSAVIATPLTAELEVATVYNLEVLEFHTYFVGRARALVRNQTANSDECPEAGTAPQSNIPQEEIDRCKQELGQRNPGAIQSTTPGGRSTRPADAFDQVCESRVRECANATDKEACEDKWDCVYQKVGAHPTSDYFETASTAARIQRQCSSKSAEVIACYRGDPTTVTQGSLAPEYQQQIQQHAADRQNASTPQAKGRASEQAGDAAAAGYANGQYPSPEWQCQGGSGARVFDRVCFNSATNQVVLLEAKGGDGDLGVRWDENHEKRVQQGTLEYVLAVAADIGKTDPAAEERIRRALRTGNLEYLRVDQKFDAQGNPKDISVRTFELDPARRGTQGC